MAVSHHLPPVTPWGVVEGGWEVVEADSIWGGWGVVEGGLGLVWGLFGAGLGLGWGGFGGQ